MKISPMPCPNRTKMSESSRPLSRGRSDVVFALSRLFAETTSLRPRLKGLLLSDIFVRFGQGIGEIFIVLYALLVVRVSPATFGWLTGLAMATSLVLYIPVSRVADRRG